eukprot:8376119-Karenia_brevis.AAC.1
MKFELLRLQMFRIPTVTMKVIFIYVSVEVAIPSKATNGQIKTILRRAWQLRNLQWQEVGSLAAAAAAAV